MAQPENEEGKRQGIGSLVWLAWDGVCLFFWCYIACLMFIGSFIGRLEDNLELHVYVTSLLFLIILGINRVRIK